MDADDESPDPRKVTGQRRGSTALPSRRQLRQVAQWAWRSPKDGRKQARSTSSNRTESHELEDDDQHSLAVLETAGILNVVVDLPSSSSGSSSDDEEDMRSLRSENDSESEADSERERRARRETGGVVLGELLYKSRPPKQLGLNARASRSWHADVERGVRGHMRGAQPNLGGSAAVAASGSLQSLHEEPSRDPSDDFISTAAGSSSSDDRESGHLMADVLLSTGMEITFASTMFQAFIGPLEEGTQFINCLTDKLRGQLHMFLTTQVSLIVRGVRRLPVMRKFGRINVKSQGTGLTYKAKLSVLFPDTQESHIRTAFEQDFENNECVLRLLFTSPNEDWRKAAHTAWREQTRKKGGRESPVDGPLAKWASDKAMRCQEVDAALEALKDPARLASIGTLHHAKGICEPCAAFMKGSCARGGTCPMCHSPDHLKKIISL